jgi:hypothetical protein
MLQKAVLITSPSPLPLMAQLHVQLQRIGQPDYPIAIDVEKFQSRAFPPRLHLEDGD